MAMFMFCGYILLVSKKALLYQVGKARHACRHRNHIYNLTPPGGFVQSMGAMYEGVEQS
jgi:hypothetical protein